MDNLFWIIENFLTQVSSAFSNFFLYGFIASMVGLAISIFLIKKGRKRNLFSRSNGFWTLLAKLNYVALPIAFMLFFGFTGGIYGVHTTADKYIDQTTEPIIEYATTFLPDFHQFVERNPGKFASIEAAVAAFDKTEENLKNQATAQASFGGMNTWLIEGLLESFGKSADKVAPLVALSQVNPNNITRGDLEILPMSLKSVCSYWMFPVYWAVFTPFFSFLMIVLGELFIYRNFFRQAKSYDSELAFA